MVIRAWYICSWRGQKDIPMYEVGNFSYLDKDNNNSALIIYASKSYEFCAKLKEHLDSKCINYSDRDIHNLKIYKEEYASLNTKFTSVTIIKERHKVIGLNVNKIESLLQE